MRGRKDTPTPILKYRGTYRKDRRKREMELKTDLPACPAWLSDNAKKEWNRIVKEMGSLGIITTLDRTVLAMHCQYIADYLEAKKIIDDEGMTNKTSNGNIIQHPAVGIKNTAFLGIMKTAVELGLTPSARCRLHLNDRQEEADPMLDLIKRRHGS
jgi:P27 family predicted phage terminase small subunit